MDARYYNGGPDDRPSFEGDGPRREPPAVCYFCGEDCDQVYVFSDVGQFCSERCREALLEIKGAQSRKGAA